MNNPESDQNYSIQYTDEDQLLDTTGSNGVKVEVIDSVGDPYTSYEHSGIEHKVYGRRWYILAVFASLGCLQCITWNSWGPIADTSKLVLNWTDGDIALLTNWGPITYIATGLFFSWLLDVKGLKPSVVAASFIMLIGLGVRCLPVGIDNIKWTMNIGQIYIGIAAPVLNAAPTILSAVWFPPHQRTTATAISIASISMGFAVSFLVGPLIVTDVETTNGTSINATDESFLLYDSNEPLDPVVRTHHYHQIMLLMYIECGVGALLALCTVLYFPSKPPTPPSASAATKRDNFKKGALHLVKNVQFWIIGLAYSGLGVYSAWVTQLDTIFQNADGVSQDTVGWIGFYTNIAATFASLIIARLVDCFQGYMKKILLILTVLATASCLWCFLLSLKIITFQIEFLYISCISFGFFLSSCTPIYFELTVEGVYPVAEGVTTMALTLLNNTAALLFLLPPLIPGLGVDWMSWAVLSTTAVGIPLLLIYRDSYNRLNQDVLEQSSRVNVNEKDI
ncbi:solute carrier family 49 member 4 homolog [Asterias rubens]|uniref:solute carrier family 49 member 4 homolog n=1 Tax=Asterias rubens TaxID=7604 RepID=UPI0014558A75|nr:solute carrier family 49 member 4 homolog [Asterias rubens]XP_033625381.1 solute carrier family 49 member 4 homolog [Asterias rubens]